MGARAAFWGPLMTADDDSQPGGALCLCVLWFLGLYLVFCGGDWWERWGMFLCLVVWELALRFADFFLRHPEVLWLEIEPALLRHGLMD